MAGLMTQKRPMPPEEEEDLAAAEEEGAPAPEPEGEEPLPPEENESAEEGPAPAEGGKATPDEEEQVKVFTANAMLLIYSDKVLKQIVRGFRENEDPGDALAQAAVLIVTRVEDSAPKPVNPDIVFEAGTTVVEELADLAGKLQLHDFSAEELNAAFLRAVDLYRASQEKQGKLNHDEYRQKVERLKQAEADGSLERMYPGLSKVADHLPKQRKEEPRPKRALGAEAPDDEEMADEEEVA